MGLIGKANFTSYSNFLISSYKGFMPNDKQWFDAFKFYTITSTTTSNDRRFIQCIYRYSHASKRFVEVYLLYK